MTNKQAIAFNRIGKRKELRRLNGLERYANGVNKIILRHAIFMLKAQLGM